MPMRGAIVDNLMMIDINNIGQIDILKDDYRTVIFGGMPVIAFHTKKDGEYNPLPSFNIKQCAPLGYQPPVKFYSPKYDSRESIENPKPDLRTIIYWKPNVVTDGACKAKLDFYTADDPATYSVIIEGMSDDGRLIHFLGNGLIRVE